MKNQIYFELVGERNRLVSEMHDLKILLDRAESFSEEAELAFLFESKVKEVGNIDKLLVIQREGMKVHARFSDDAHFDSRGSFGTFQKLHSKAPVFITPSSEDARNVLQ